MRTKNSLINIIVSISNNLINILMNLFAQRFFLINLGEKYLGLNGIFVNTLSILAIAELGIGTAIIFNLYKPIKENDREKIKELIYFYKKCYKVIVVFMILISLAIMPFLKLIVGDLTGISENIYILYILFVFDILISYFIAYKKSILIANQKEYISNLIHIGYVVIMNILQIIFLIYTKNYLVYLIIKIFSRMTENILVNIIINKKYSYIKEKPEKELNENTKKDIMVKVKSLFLHKIAGFVVTGTDTILISIFLGGLVTVGYYSNYNLIFSSVTTIFSQIFYSMTASVGNLLVSETTEKNKSIFEKMLFLNFGLYTFASVCLFCIIEPFISIWIGNEYLLPKFVLIALTVNFYMQGMRKTTMAFKEAAGIFYEDRFVPILEALINIVASIILLKMFGLAGIFLGTIASTLILFLYSYPKYVYKKLFNDSGIKYIITIFKYFILSVVITAITYVIVILIPINSSLIQVIVNMLICLIIPILLIIIIYHKNNNFTYFVELLKEGKDKVKKLIKKEVK